MSNMCIGTSNAFYYVWEPILAQTETGEAASGITSESVEAEQTSTKTLAPGSETPAETGRQRPAGSPMSSFILIGLMFVVMYFLLFRGPRKKQQQHKQMVQSLKKNDRVRTIGGIIGIVVDIKDKEITLKVDESNNTKIKVAPTAIAQNVSNK